MESTKDEQEVTVEVVPQTVTEIIYLTEPDIVNAEPNYYIPSEEELEDEENESYQIGSVDPARLQHMSLILDESQSFVLLSQQEDCFDVKMMSKNKKMNELNLKEKMEVLKFAATHSERDTARKFLISKTTVNNIKKRKAEITQRYSEESHNQQRKRRSTEFDEINRRVLIWFRKMRSIDGKISGPMLQEVAMKIARHLKLPQFKASNGWLEAFKKRYGILQKVLQSNNKNVNPETVEGFRMKLPELCRDFLSSNIFCANECSLFFKAMPDRTLAIKSDACKSGELSSQRHTVLLAVSVAGEKLKPLVIGKSLQPRSFKTIKISDLPVLWRANKKAWMTTDLFTEWLNIINDQMISENRRILLFVSNCPAHPKLLTLSNIKLLLLPKDSTLVLQPLNQGIIQNFKFFYRSFLLSTVVAKMKDGRSASDISASINVLQSVLWISEAWSNVQAETISNCFQRAGFNFIKVNAIKNEVETVVENFQNYNMEDFTTCDDHVACWEVLSPKEILESVLRETNQESGDDYEEEESLPLSELNQLTSTEVSKMMDKIFNFVAVKFPDILLPISMAKNKVSEEVCKLQLSLKQKTLEEYFKTKT